MNDAPKAGPSPTETFTVATFRRYGGELQQYLLRRLPRSQDAEDVFQEVFMRLLRVKDATFVRDPRAYIYGIALHVAREFRMRDERTGTRITFDPETIRSLADHPDEVPADDMAERLSLQREIEAALEKLPPLHKTIFLLHKRDGYSYEEIAGQLSLSVNTVDKYLVQAKAWIRTLHWER